MLLVTHFESGVETFVHEGRRMYNVHICLKNLIQICIIPLSFPHGPITIRQTKIQTYSHCKQQPALCAQLFLLPEIKSLYGSVKMPQMWGILPPTPEMQHQQCQPGGQPDIAGGLETMGIVEYFITVSLKSCFPIHPSGTSASTDQLAPVKHQGSYFPAKLWSESSGFQPIK